MNEWIDYRIKDIARYIGSGTTPSSNSEKYYADEGYMWVNTGDLNNDLVFDCKQRITDVAIRDYKTLRFYPSNTILEAMYGATIGKVGLLQSLATVNQACCAIVPFEQKVSPKFVLYYLIDYKDRLICESCGGTQPNVNQKIVTDIPIKLPSLKTQQRIVDYLDSHVASIDKRVSLLMTKRDHYLRLKTAIINRAVTQGLNPDVKMKDSGVEWIGMIPEHWEVKRIKEIGKLRLGKMLTDKPKEGFVLKSYLKSKNVSWLSLNLESVEEMYFSKQELKDLRLHNGDLVIAEGGEVGKTAIWRDELQECYIQNSVHKLTFNKLCDSRYYCYFSYFLGQKDYYKSIVNLVSIMHLTYEKLRRLSVPVPPLSEQQAIANYLDEKCGKIDAIVENLNQQIEKHKLLKRALINEVITGQRAV